MSLGYVCVCVCVYYGRSAAVVEERRVSLLIGSSVLLSFGRDIVQPLKECFWTQSYVMTRSYLRQQC